MVIIPQNSQIFIHEYGMIFILLSSIISALYTFSFFLLLNDIHCGKEITRHIKEMH